MNETNTAPIKGTVTREQAIAAFKPFVESGITNSDAIDLKDPVAKEADNLYYTWQSQLDAEAQGNIELEHRANISKAMFYIDAGFTDPAHLQEVLTQWLAEGSIEEIPGNAERAETLRLLAEARTKVQNLLNK
jgi:hypothetical protein